jgi:hypothetical protein
MDERPLVHPKLLQKADSFCGTNCKNCKFYDSKTEVDASPDELNSQGGLEPKTEEETQRAKDTDLITLPGDNVVLKKAMCSHPEVAQMVTPKMCCAKWDHGEAIRPWEGDGVAKSEGEADLEVPHDVVMRNSLPHRQDG